MQRTFIVMETPCLLDDLFECRWFFKCILKIFENVDRLKREMLLKQDINSYMYGFAL